jgi:hypothetical protein
MFGAYSLMLALLLASEHRKCCIVCDDYCYASCGFPLVVVGVPLSLAYSQQVHAEQKNVVSHPSLSGYLEQRIERLSGYFARISLALRAIRVYCCCLLRDRCRILASV